jgi:type I restriction enzyme M protein
MLSNPPFGVTWGGKDGYESETRKLAKNRYRAGLPRVNDGALLFLQTMLAKMKEAAKGESRIAIIFNGSPLSNGDCGSGESEIRPLDPRKRLARRDRHAARPALLQHRNLHLRLAAAQRQAGCPSRPRDAHRRPPSSSRRNPSPSATSATASATFHRAWIETRYRDGWQPEYRDEQVKVFRCQDFALPQGQRRLLAVRRKRSAGNAHRAPTKKPSPPPTSGKSRSSTTVS